MLNPKEQAKGGFGAQIARADERQQNLERAAQSDGVAADLSGAGSPGATPTPKDDDQADGAPAVAPKPQAQPAPPSARPSRPVKRWR